jgi:hypothetical protein
MFRETTTDYENSWHRAPCRQYVISLAGGISITASDGETHHIGAGVIVLVEDTTGKGLRTVDGLLPKSFGQRRAGSDLAIAVGTPITGRPPHRTVRAAFLHTAPTSDV